MVHSHEDDFLPKVHVLDSSEKSHLFSLLICILRKKSSTSVFVLVAVVLVRASADINDIVRLLCDVSKL